MLEDHRRLFLEHLLGQAERGDVRAHQPAGLVVLLEDGDLVAERHEVVGDGERGRTRADARDALAVLLGRDDGEPVRDVAREGPLATRFSRQIATG